MGGNRDQLEGTLEMLMLNNIKIDFDMFGSFVEEINMSNLNGTLIVIVVEVDTAESCSNHRNQRSSDVVSTRT